jgi:hypothetical protein
MVNSDGGTEWDGQGELQCTLQKFASRVRGKPHKTSAKVASLRVNIWARGLEIIRPQRSVKLFDTT